jgi:ADP-ribosylglycohydrolase
LDGTASGGRYTDEAMRDVWQARKNGVGWRHAGSYKDTAEAAIRTPIIAGLYANDRDKAFKEIIRNVALTHCDPVVLGQSTAFGLHVWMLINGINLQDIRSYNSKHRDKFKITFKMAADWWGKESNIKLNRHEISFFDHMGRPSSIYEAAHDPEIVIEPAHAVCRLYTLDCRITHLLPAAYYLASRFEDDFEMAVLSAVNGGGNNMARAALTGALLGAMVGINGIPERFITGLTDNKRIISQIDSINLSRTQI